MKTKIETFVTLQINLEDASHLATGLTKTIRNRTTDEREAIDKLSSELKQITESVNPPPTE